MVTDIKETNLIYSLNDYLFKSTPQEVVNIMNSLTPKECAEIFTNISADSIKIVWPYLTPLLIANVATFLDDEFIINLSNQVDEVDFTLLLRQYDSNRQESILSKIDHNKANKVKEFLFYPKDTAGYLMRSGIYTFFENTTVKEVVSQIKQRKTKSVSVVYIIDENLQLKGFVNVYKILIANELDKMSKLMKKSLVYITDFTLKEEIIDIIKKKPMHDLPVVNAQGQLIGSINSPVLLDSVQEDAYSDIQTMVGVSKDEKALSPSFFSVKKRLPWLEINLLTAFLAAFVVGLFENLISEFTVLAILLPVVAGQSGNAGAQALAVTMRGLTLREVSTKNGLLLYLKNLKLVFSQE